MTAVPTLPLQSQSLQTLLKPSNPALRFAGTEQEDDHLVLSRKKLNKMSKKILIGSALHGVLGLIGNFALIKFKKSISKENQQLIKAINTSLSKTATLLLYMGLPLLLLSTDKANPLSRTLIRKLQPEPSSQICQHNQTCLHPNP
jgi:hypothetical protein